MTSSRVALAPHPRKHDVCLAAEITARRSHALRRVARPGRNTSPHNATGVRATVAQGRKTVRGRERGATLAGREPRYIRFGRGCPGCSFSDVDLTLRPIVSARVFPLSSKTAAVKTVVSLRPLPRPRGSSALREIISVFRLVYRSRDKNSHGASEGSATVPYLNRNILARRGGTDGYKL